MNTIRYNLKMQLIHLLLFGTMPIFAQVTILEITPQRLRFTFATGDIALTENNQATTSLSFSKQNFQCGQKDEPLLPAYAFMVGSPSNTAHPLVSLDAQETYTQSLPYPVATSTGIQTTWNPDFSGSFISQPNQTSMRNLRVFQYVINPFSYDASARKITVLKRATVTILFPNAPFTAQSTVARSEWEKARESLLLNGTIAAGWTPQTALLRKSAALSFPLARTKPLIHFTIGDGNSGFNETTTNENGLFDGNDYCLAPVTGSSDWVWSNTANESSWKFNLHRYDPFRIPVVNNAFDQLIRLPRSVAFDKSGARITAFAYRGGAPVSAAGSTPLMFHGSILVESNDSAGPAISVRPLYYDKTRNSKASFTDKLTTSTPCELEILVSDSSGVDASNDGPGEGISLEIPHFIPRHSIKSTFKFTNGDYRTGSSIISFKKDELPPGEYSMSISARDLLGHASIAAINLTIVASENFNLSRVFNYPNPMRVNQTTRFFFYGTTPSFDNGYLSLMRP